MVEATLIRGDNLVGGLQQIRRDGTLNRLLQQCLVVDLAQFRLADLEHDTPVRTFLRVRVGRLVTIGQTQSGESNGICRGVVLGIVGKDRSSVAWGVIAREVQPAWYQFCKGGALSHLSPILSGLEPLTPTPRTIVLEKVSLLALSLIFSTL